jgi:hypothetical protein
MEEDSSSVVEAKKLYTIQLIDTLTPVIYEGIKSIFDSSKDSEKVLITFQEKLCSIVRWNQDIIDKEYSRIVAKSSEEALSSLIDAVFISNVKVLSSIRIAKTDKIHIKVPEARKFIHRAYVETARQVYQDPYLFDDRENRLEISEIQRNVRRAKNLIGISIEKTVRDLIPLQDIIGSYLHDMGLDDVKEDLQEERRDIMEGETQEEKDDGEAGSEEAGPSYQNHDDFFMEEPQEVSASPDLEVATGRTAAETPGGFVNNAVETPEPRVVNVDLREKEDFFSDDEEQRQPRNSSNDTTRKNYFSDSDSD